MTLNDIIPRNTPTINLNDHFGQDRLQVTLVEFAHEMSRGVIYPVNTLYDLQMYNITRQYPIDTPTPQTRPFKWSPHPFVGLILTVILV